MKGCRELVFSTGIQVFYKKNFDKEFRILASSYKNSVTVVVEKNEALLLG